MQQVNEKLNMYNTLFYKSENQLLDFLYTSHTATPDPEIIIIKKFIQPVS
jgi:hypothetical protein